MSGLIVVAGMEEVFPMHVGYHLEDRCYTGTRGGSLAWLCVVASGMAIIFQIHACIRFRFKMDKLRFKSERLRFKMDADEIYIQS